MAKEKDLEVPQSWLFFLEDMRSIERLLSTGTHPDQFKNPDDFLRPVPILLRSAWETFNSRSVEEGAAFLAHFTDSHEKLPKELKKQIAQEIKKEKHELSPWKLSGKGWKAIVVKRVKIENNRLKSGKSKDLDDYYLNALGLSNISKGWKPPHKSKVGAAALLGMYLEKRNKIIHQGELHLPSEECWNFFTLIHELAIRTILSLDRHIKNLTGKRFCNASIRQLREIVRKDV